MGILDRFFKNKKIITETVEKALEEDIKTEKKPLPQQDNAAAEEKNDDAEKVKAAEKLRNLAKQYLPGDVSSVYAQKEMIKILVETLGIPESTVEEADKVLEKLKKGEQTPLESSAALGNNINTLLKDADEAKAASIGENSENRGDLLLKTWVVLDYLTSTLKPDFSENLRRFRDRITEIVNVEGFAKEDVDAFAEMLALEKECKELRDDKEKAGELAEKRKQLLEMLLERKALFVLFDDDFNSAFPYVSFDGRIEISTRYETACALKKHYEKIHSGHTCVRRIEKKEFDKMFKAMQHIGISAARFDNGTFPVDIPVGEITKSVPANLIERFNGGMRGLFLRNLQYGARLAKVKDEIKGTAEEKAMLEAMLTCRFNSYREFGNSIVYVFANPPYEKGVTLYSKNALERAKKLCEAAKLDEKALVAPGDAEIKQYEGGMNFRVTHKSEDSSMENSCVCVFTSRLEAEKARLHFEKFGCNDSVVAVTYDELAGQITDCAGALIDMSSYGLEIKKKEFEEIKRWRTVKGRIAVNLKKKEENDNTPETEKEN